MNNNTSINLHEATQEEKNRHWNALREAADKITDKLGMPIDEEIKELVVSLNALGFRTSMSCYGHIRENKKLGIKNYALTPYVSIKPRIDEKLENEYLDLRKKLSIHWDERKKEEYFKADKEFREFIANTSRPYHESMKRLIELFTEYYKTRQVPYDIQLSLTGAPRNFRIENIGNRYIYLNDQAEKKRKLKAYQDEFIAFGKFLKTRYLS